MTLCSALGGAIGGYVWTNTSLCEEVEMAAAYAEVDTKFYFESTSTSLDSDTFRVVSFQGEEEISRPYRFEIELVSENPEIDVDEVMRWPAWLGIERNEELRKLHGVIAEFDQKQGGPDNLYFYRAVLVPRLWLLSLSRQNQIYQHRSVPRIIEEELKGAHKKGDSKVGSLLTADDYELQLTIKCADPSITLLGDPCEFDPGTYPSREFVVQYKETDLDFISRLMEHQGLFYFFTHDDEKEKLIITDDNVHLPAIGEESEIPFRSPTGMTPSSASIHSLVCRQTTIPKKVILRDYNYRKAHLPLQAEADVDPGGHGVVSDYGDHFKVPEEGVLSKVPEDWDVVEQPN